jgi:hypothetical protein
MLHLHFAFADNAMRARTAKALVVIFDIVLPW